MGTKYCNCIYYIVTANYNNYDYDAIWFYFTVLHFYIQINLYMVYLGTCLQKKYIVIQNNHEYADNII